MSELHTVRNLISLLEGLDPDARIAIRVIDAGCGCCAGEDSFEPIVIDDDRTTRGHFTLV